jgi:hypothetical protein
MSHITFYCTEYHVQRLLSRSDCLSPASSGAPSQNQTTRTDSHGTPWQHRAHQPNPALPTFADQLDNRPGLPRGPGQVSSGAVWDSTVVRVRAGSGVLQLWPGELGGARQRGLTPTSLRSRRFARLDSSVQPGGFPSVCTRCCTYCTWLHVKMRGRSHTSDWPSFWSRLPQSSARLR